MKAVLLYDNTCPNLGNFFIHCANNFRYLANQCDVSLFNTENIKKEDFEDSISTVNQKNFLFVSFLHGDAECMYIDNEEIIGKNNAYFFSNSFCYTFSCDCGQVLAQNLINNKTHCFWGYKDKAYCIIDKAEEFVELSLFGLKCFFEGKSLSNSFALTQKEFLRKINETYQTDYFLAATMMHNRDAMTILGNDSLQISDFSEK